MLYYILAAVIVVSIGVYTWIYHSVKEEEEDELIVYTEEITIMGKRTLRHYCGDYEIWEIFEFFSKEETQKCIDIAERLDKTGKVENKKPNMIARLDKDNYELMEKLGKIVSNLMNTPIEHKDRFGIYKYIPGTNIEGHYDGCSSKKDKACEEVEVSNIIFLNDDYKGGELYFRMLDLKIKPELGKMIMFKAYDKDGKLVFYSGFESAKIQNGMQYLLR
jgi:hypothetical protein